MEKAPADHESRILSQSWRSTPDNYSSLRYMRLHADGSGDLIYGYGQTIYIVMPCAWEIVTLGRLRLIYSAPTSGRLADGFVLNDENRVKELDYTLTAGEVSGVEDICGAPYKFDWTLELSEPPWPSILKLPYEVPRIFYGRAIAESDPDD